MYYHRVSNLQDATHKRMRLGQLTYKRNPQLEKTRRQGTFLPGCSHSRAWRNGRSLFGVRYSLT